MSSAITVTSEIKLTKKERCKFYPACTRGERCDYHHPTTPCKAFPNCKYGDICLYIHPKCKFDLTCSRLDCNFTHTPVASAAPPLGNCYVPHFPFKIPQNFLAINLMINCHFGLFYSFSCRARFKLQEDCDNTIAHAVPFLSELFKYAVRILSPKAVQIWKELHQ